MASWGGLTKQRGLMAALVQLLHDKLCRPLAKIPLSYSAEEHHELQSPVFQRHLHCFSLFGVGIVSANALVPRATMIVQY